MPVAHGDRMEVFEYQETAHLIQAAPVQNTFYTILEEDGGIRVYQIGARIADTGETLNLRVTVDGQVRNAEAVACNADTDYQDLPYIQSLAGVITDKLTNNVNKQYNAFTLEGHSVKVEIRKTTANGAGTLYGTVDWGLIQKVA